MAMRLVRLCVWLCLFHWGYKWINQITAIEAVDFDYKGTYESQGYSDDGDVTQPVPTFPTYSSPAPTFHPTPTQTSEPSSSISPTPSVSKSANSTMNQPKTNTTLGEITGAVVAILIIILALALVLRRKKMKVKETAVEKTG